MNTLTDFSTANCPISAHQAKYFAYELTSRKSGMEGLGEALLNAKVDLNPHQIEAAVFALKNPLQQGVLLADEVGLGKTIEAALVLCQLWAEDKRKLLIICPASLRQQWEQELRDKFALPALVVDKTVIRRQKISLAQFFSAHIGKQVLIMSYQFAAQNANFLQATGWHLLVIDEAHKLRNAHRKTNRNGQILRKAFASSKKILLSATPLQNSLMELYGLSTILDEHLFGDEKQFRKTYASGANRTELKQRMKGFIQRTLRQDVQEYVRYTKRYALTQRFEPTNAEHAFYQQISDFLQREDLLTLPKRQRHLIRLILRKLLASSPQAIVATLQKMQQRLRDLLEETKLEQEALAITDLIDEDELNSDETDWQEASEIEADQDGEKNEEPEECKISAKTDRLQAEILELEGFIEQAQALIREQDSKANALLTALEQGFAEMAKLGAARKAIIFTESVRTQQHLSAFLAAHGWQGKIVNFSGSLSDPQSNAIYQQWLQANQGDTKISGSSAIDKRTALIDYFRDEAEIMIAIEAAAEGVNLQFCSLLINYDLPWNPQRIEQRIGRCHRYGQKFDVVVINFLNNRNEADRRVLELLSEKLDLFSGIFGASDEVLGKIDEALDFENRIAEIYNTCRTPSEIQAAFDRLQQELDAQISQRKEETQQTLLDEFDVDVHERIKIDPKYAKDYLNRVNLWFWHLSRYALQHYAEFAAKSYHFQLYQSPLNGVATGNYHLLSVKQARGFEYRSTDLLGKWCIEQSLKAVTPNALLRFDYTNYPRKISKISAHQGKQGWLWLDKFTVRSEVDLQSQMLFTARTDEGEWLDDDFCHKLLLLPSEVCGEQFAIPADLQPNAAQKQNAAVNKAGEDNMQLIREETLRLEKWSEDQKQAVEQALADLGEKIRETRRNRDQAPNLNERLEWEQKLKKSEMEQKKLRLTIFDLHDEIDAKREELIAQIRQKIEQQCSVEHLFVVRWAIQ